MSLGFLNSCLQFSRKVFACLLFPTSAKNSKPRTIFILPIIFTIKRSRSLQNEKQNTAAVHHRNIEWEEMGYGSSNAVVSFFLMTEESIYKIQTNHRVICHHVTLTFFPRSSVDEYIQVESSSSSKLTRLPVRWLPVVHGGLWRTARRASPRLSTGITCGQIKQGS